MKKLVIIASVILSMTLASVPASAGDTEKGILIGVLGTLIGQEIAANRRHRHGNAHVHGPNCGHTNHSVPSPSHHHPVAPPAGRPFLNGISNRVDHEIRVHRLRSITRHYKRRNRIYHCGYYLGDC